MENIIILMQYFHNGFVQILQLAEVEVQHNLDKM
jgi:hypothetical protein